MKRSSSLLSLGHTSRKQSPFFLRFLTFFFEFHSNFSLKKTRWEKRSLEEHLKDPRGQAIYSVVHGGMDLQLRKSSISFLSSLPFDGMAVGGSVGRDRNHLFEFLSFLSPLLPVDKPKHLLGIAEPYSVHSVILHGFDTFDSCFPTRAARHGNLFVFQDPKSDLGGKWPFLPFDAEKDVVRIRQGKHAAEHGIKIDRNCACYSCTNFDRSYLHHLFKTSEATALTLATIHNITVMNKICERYKELILEGKI